jgi:hypothetical protein
LAAAKGPPSGGKLIHQIFALLAGTEKALRSERAANLACLRKEEGLAYGGAPFANKIVKRRGAKVLEWDMEQLEYIAEIARRLPLEGAAKVAEDFWNRGIKDRWGRLWGKQVPSASLGEAEGNRIDLDTNAAGSGWLVNSTPTWKEEFTPSQNNQPLPAVDPRVVDRMDLGTVVEHELGHVAGLNDANTLTDDIMSGVLGNCCMSHSLRLPTLRVPKPAWLQASPCCRRHWSASAVRSPIMSASNWASPAKKITTSRPTVLSMSMFWPPRN